MAAYPYFDTLHAQAIDAIDARENMMIEMCRQQGATTFLLRILESLQDREWDVAVVSTSRDAALEIVEHFEYSGEESPLRVMVLSNHGPERDEDDNLEPFDLVLMDNVYHMKKETVEVVTKGYNYVGTTTPTVDDPPPLQNLTHHVDARWRLKDGTIVQNRMPPWLAE